MWLLTLNTALVGAHVQKSDLGFRQRDVKFLMELFWNWQSSFLNRGQFENVHNNQIKRILHQLVSDAWAANVGKGTPPRHRLTRSGFIEILKKIKEEGLNGRFEEFLFARYFFRSYQDRIFSFIEKAGAPMPLSFRTEIRELFDVEKLENQKIANLQKEINYFKERIIETEGTISFTQSQLKEGVSLEKIAKKIEEIFPYELNYQKPLTQLFKETPPELQKWELIEGNLLRIKLLWTNYIGLFQHQLDMLQ